LIGADSGSIHPYTVQHEILYPYVTNHVMIHHLFKIARCEESFLNPLVMLRSFLSKENIRNNDSTRTPISQRTDYTFAKSDIDEEAGWSFISIQDDECIREIGDVNGPRSEFWDTPLKPWFAKQNLFPKSKNLKEVRKLPIVSSITHVVVNLWEIGHFLMYCTLCNRTFSRSK